MQKILAGALAALAVSAHADVALTVYNQDLAVVREQRDFDLKAGSQSVKYGGVASQLDATSVHLDGDGIRLLEQDYDFDLVNADKLLEKHLDLGLKASMKGGSIVEGTLLSFDGAQLVLKKAGGGVTMLNRNEVTNLDFAALPGGLITKPTLVWKLDSKKSGKLPLTLTYMTGGISWHAEYVATLADDEKTLDLNGWVSLDNRSGATYEDATLKLIAGEVNRVQPAQDGMLPLRKAMMTEAMAAPAPPQFQERSFFDYHLYTLQRPVTVRDSQVKQVDLFSAADVPVKKAYLFDGEQSNNKVAVTVELKNEEAAGLGMPLPAGKVRVFKTDASAKGGSEFIGEDSVGHTPRDEKLRLKLGNAFDVVGERTVMDERPDDKGRQTERTVKIELRNRKKDAVSVTVREHAFGRWEILEGDLKEKKKDAQTFEFDVPLKAGEEKTLQYRVRMKW